RSLAFIILCDGDGIGWRHAGFGVVFPNSFVAVGSLGRAVYGAAARRAQGQRQERRATMSVLEASAWMVGTPRVPGAVGTPSPACHSEPVHEAAPSGETQARPLSMKFQYMV